MARDETSGTRPGWRRSRPPKRRWHGWRWCRKGRVEPARATPCWPTSAGTTLEDRYLLPGESYRGMFARVSTAFADDADRAQRVYDYMSRLWFSCRPRPVLSNGGADLSCLPISCFPERRQRQPGRGILSVWNENVWLAANGGGIGTFWGGVRSIGSGEKVKGQGPNLGHHPPSSV
ncbi:ribonucleotide reductase N-terminal alpha domain-containing protein [Caulobacter segnis]